MKWNRPYTGKSLLTFKTNQLTKMYSCYAKRISIHFCQIHVWSKRAYLNTTYDLQDK